MTLLMSRQLRFTINPSRVEILGHALRTLMGWAYQFKPEFILGPTWIESDRFNIVAKPPEGASREQVLQMLRNLLVERFRLAVHTDLRPLTHYALVLGQKPLTIKPSSVPDSPGSTRCTPIGRCRLFSCTGMSMERLAQRMSTQWHIPGGFDLQVTDMTGLSGRYDFTLDLGFMGDGDPPECGSKTVSITDAVKALGLKLEMRKVQQSFLIIDHVERSPLPD